MLLYWSQLSLRYWSWFEFSDEPKLTESSALLFSGQALLFTMSKPHQLSEKGQLMVGVMDSLGSADNDIEDVLSNIQNLIENLEEAIQ